MERGASAGTGAHADGELSTYRSWTADTVTVPTVPAEITADLSEEMSPVCV